MPRVIILNAPPGAGKDTIGAALAGRLSKANSVTMASFKTALYEQTADHFGINLNTLRAWCTDRDLKDAKCPALMLGMAELTPREALIHVSENIIKPKHGKDFFGQQVKWRIERSPVDYVIITDGGFEDEVAPLRDVADVTIVHMYRDGCSFDRDSRTYLQNPHAVVYNNGTVDEAVDAILGMLAAEQ